MKVSTDIITQVSSNVKIEISQLTFEDFRANYDDYCSLGYESNIEDITEYVKSLINKGYSLVPVYKGMRKTGSRYKHWQEKQLTKERQRHYLKMNCNWALLPCYSGHLSLDLDFKDTTEKQKEAIWRFIELHWDIFKLSPITLTPSGGMHVTIDTDKNFNSRFYFDGFKMGEGRHTNYGLIPGSFLEYPETGEVRYYRELNSLLIYEPQFISHSDLQIELTENYGGKSKSKKSKAKKDKTNSGIDLGPLTLEHPNVCDKYFNRAIKRAVKKIEQSKEGSRFFVFRKQVIKIAALISGYQKLDIPVNDNRLQELYEIGLSHNADNSNMSVDTVYHDSSLYGFSNPRVIIFKKSDSNTLHLNKGQCHDLTFFKIAEIYQEHYSRKLRKDSKLVIVWNAIYTSKTAVDIKNYNGSGQYISRGLMTRCPSESQLVKFTGLNPNTIHQCLKQLEEMGIILRYRPDEPDKQSSIICIGNVVGYFLDSPIPPSERTNYSQYEKRQPAKSEPIKFKRPEPVPEFDY